MRDPEIRNERSRQLELLNEMIQYLKDEDKYTADNRMAIWNLIGSHIYFKEVWPDKHTVTDEELKPRLCTLIDKMGKEE